MARFEDPGAEVDRLVKQTMRDYRVASYTKAMEMVFLDPRNAELKRAYAFEGRGARQRNDLESMRENLGESFRESLVPTSSPPPSTRTAGYKVHEKIVARRRANPSESYSQAMSEVLRLNPELKSEFARSA